MGSGSSKRNTISLTDITDSQRRAFNRKIESELEKEKLQNVTTVTILLLGGTCSGKTTVLKQMRILHTNGFSNSDLINYRYVIHNNVVKAMIQLVEAADTFLLLDLSNEALKWDICKFREFVTLGSMGYYEIDSSIAECISRLWRSGPIQAVFKRRFTFELIECAHLFLDDLERISDRNYLPTHQDILHCRFRTTGIYEINFPFKTMTLRMIDVGGQKSEQRKWIHCFDNVQLVLFIASLSEYDQLDEETNRLQQSLELFTNISSLTCFSAASFVLFLNKSDIFRQKIQQKIPLTTAFPDYKGEIDNYESTAAYIMSEFKEGYKHNQTLYGHFTMATDTENINFVFNSCMDQILIHNMSSAGVW